jgi:hypothetical protein
MSTEPKSQPSCGCCDSNRQVNSLVLLQMLLPLLPVFALLILPRSQ